MYKSLFYFTILIFLLGCSEKDKVKMLQSSTNDSLKQAGKELKFGTITRSFLNIQQQFKPFDNYIAKQVSDFGYTSAKTVLTSTVEEIENKINQGEVDIYSASLYSTIYLDLKTDMEPVLSRAINGNEKLNTVFFTRQESDIKTLDDLLGKVIVFEHEFSTSGYFIPKMSLINKGYNLIQVESPRQVIDSNSIGYCFSNHDKNSIAWVLKEQAVAAATDNESFKTYSGQKLDELKIIYTTREYLRFLVSFNRNLSSKIKEKLIKAFIEYPKIATQDSLLKDYYETIEFKPINKENYLSLRKEFERDILN